MDGVAEAQAQLAVAVEKERSATEELHAIKAQLASLESQNSILRQEKGRLQGQLDAERTRREKLEDDNSRYGGGFTERLLSERSCKNALGMSAICLHDDRTELSVALH